MKETTAHPAYEHPLAAQWAVFFARTQRDYQYRPKSFTLPSGKCYTPDFYVSDLGWVSVSEDRSMYEPLDGGVIDIPARMRVRESFALFFEFASDSKEWCYWLGGAIPFWSLSEVRESVAFTLEDLEDPAWIHRSERLREEWPHSYDWYKLRRHNGPKRLPQTANKCGHLLGNLRGANFKMAFFDDEEFQAFNHKAALIAARSTAL